MNSPIPVYENELGPWIFRRFTTSRIFYINTDQHRLAVNLFIYKTKINKYLLVQFKTERTFFAVLTKS